MDRNPTRRKAAAMETRRIILEAAKEIYSAEADAEAPISRVARKAGVAEGTIFVHFPDKPSLLAATLEDELERVLADAWAGLPADATCREQLLHLARELYAFYSRRPPLFRVLIKEARILRGEWGKRTVAYTLRFVGHVAEMMERAKARGEYRRDVDSLPAARGFFGLYFLELLAGLNEEVFDPAPALDRLGEALAQFEKGLVRTTEDSQ
jgi:AcrR family transcriptional regulator